MMMNNDMNIKQKLISLETQLCEFNNDYNKNQLLNIYDKSPNELLIDTEINKLNVQLKSSIKHLNDIGLYVSSLINPDITKYKTWNINQMIQWISLLENDRFKQYLGTLRNGFESDDINSGQYLPDLTKNDLRAPPFNISVFKDRRDLEIHFKSLKNPHIGFIEYQNEGTNTEYI